MRSLKEKAVAGATWTSASSAVAIGSQFLQLAVMARILQPKDFGLIAMIMVVIGFARAYADMGISNAIIHKQDATREQLSSLYWLNIVAGVLVFAVIILTKPLIIAFYNEPKLDDLITWSALIFLIVPFGQQFQVLLKKELRFNKLAKIEIVSVVAGTAVAIVSAILGQGVFSFIWGQLANSSLKVLMLLGVGMKEWKPRFYIKIGELKDYLGFGAYQMGERSFNYLAANIDYVIIGRFLGPEALGAYTIAYQLAVLPTVRINPILTQVAFPVFAKKQTDNDALQRGYLELSKMLAFVSFPVLVGLAIVAPVAVPLFLGSGWETAIPLIQILVIVGILKSLGNPIGSILLAKGRADIGFKWNLFTAAVNSAVLYWAVSYGVHAVAWAFCILSVGYFVLMRFILQSLIGLKWQDYLNVLARPAISTLLMGIGIYAVYLSLAGTFAPRLAFGSILATGLVIYSSASLKLDKDFLSELRELLLKRSKRKL